MVKRNEIPDDVNEINWQKWQPNMRATLLFIVDGDRVLLIRKKRGLGAGKINGPGGKIDPGETPEQAAVREVQEELQVTPIEPEKFGEISFQFKDGLALHCHIFRAQKWHGEEAETDEAIPIWTKLDSIPYDEMWPDDKIWLPSVLGGTGKFKAQFIFDDEKMLSHCIDWEKK